MSNEIAVEGDQTQEADPILSEKVRTIIELYAEMQVHLESQGRPVLNAHLMSSYFIVRALALLMTKQLAGKEASPEQRAALSLSGFAVIAGLTFGGMIDELDLDSAPPAAIEAVIAQFRRAVNAGFDTHEKKVWDELHARQGQEAPEVAQGLNDAGAPND